MEDPIWTFLKEIQSKEGNKNAAPVAMGYHHFKIKQKSNFRIDNLRHSTECGGNVDRLQKKKKK